MHVFLVRVCSEIFRACFCTAKLCTKMCSDKKFLKLYRYAVYVAISHRYDLKTESLNS